jgi:TRAP-type C4-dicarboxylate transport system permease small subunit
MLKAMLACLSKVEKSLIAALLFFNVAILFVTVVMRYLFNNPPVWPEEASRYVMIWIIYLGVSQSIENNGEIKIDILTQFSSAAWIGRFAPAVACIIGFSASVAMVVLGIQFAAMLVETQQVAASFPAQMSHIYVIIPISGVLMCVKYAVRLAGQLSSAKTLAGSNGR